MMSNFNENVIVCDECSAEFLMKSVKIEECSVRVDNKNLLLDYFVCPKCNKIYKVLLVEETKYRGLVNDLMYTMERIHKLQGLGNYRQLDKLQRMALRKKEKVQQYVKGMENQYPGTFTFVASENNQKEIRYVTVNNI